MASFAALRSSFGLSSKSSFAVRRVVAASTTKSNMMLVQKRGMALGGHHGPPPEWTGVDKVVRGYFPEDYQLAIAILSAYGGLVVLYKIKSAMSSKPAAPVVAVAAPAVASTADAGAVPAIDSPAFEKFVETDAFYKLLENEEQLKGLVESA